ncbi:MAG: pilus assembly protein [Schaedlerella sp.]|nr:pilus assembly protein [Schaedlerella sp.]
MEAALTIPFFLFAVLCLIYLLEIQAVGFSIRSASQIAAKQAAEDMALLPVLNVYGLQQDIVDQIGSERLDRSIIEGGSAGIQCQTSYYNTITEEIVVKVKYTVKLPIPQFMNLGMKQKIEFRIKAWTGYASRNLSEEEEIVYVTNTGWVYHTDYQCSYLQLSITFIPSSSLPDVRNESGGIYHACENCVHGEAMAGVYITEFGGKYHNALNCSGLKRTIRAVKKSDVSGWGGCVKCSN